MMYKKKETIKIAVNKLKPHSKNPKKHNDELIEKSINDLGYAENIVIDENNVILAGHGRVNALKKRGDTETEAIQITGWTEEEKEKYLLLSNQATILGGFDDIKLKDFTGEVLDYAGLDADILIEPDEKDDEIPDSPPPVCQLGDLWKLGNHRLLCGDATKIEDVERLMDGKKADMVFTDPPYALFGNSTGVGGITDDNMVRPFFLSIFRMIRKYTKPFGHIYTCCDWHSAFSLQAMAKETGLSAKNLCIWDKGDGGIGGMYQNCYEMIWFFSNSMPITKTTVRKSGERTVNGKPNIWRVGRAKLDRTHNAQKPLELMENAVHNSSDIGELVVDIFGGSGSTLIACEKTNRICYMLELDPKYCDVIIKRWEDYTGLKAEKL